jgi:hypothetical protein
VRILVRTAVLSLCSRYDCYDSVLYAIAAAALW